MVYWTVPPDWDGETVFIIGGGPSVSGQNVSRLEGRKVIAVNSSYELCPWADIIFTLDARWLRYHRAALERFAGLIVTSADHVKWPHVRHVKKVKPPPGITTNRQQVVGRRTSLQGAMNLSVHLGASRLVLLGADGKRADNGRSHHHKPHPWRVKEGCWDEQKLDLKHAARDLRAMGIPVLNASPGSAWADLWPVTTLTDALAQLEATR